MTDPATAVESIPAVGHDEAMHLAREENDRLLAVADQLSADDWSQPTDCPGWDVKSLLGHVLGMFELQADSDERLRQVKTAAGIVEQTGGVRLHAMTALQVKEHAHLTPVALLRDLHAASPRALAARSSTTDAQRAAPYAPQLPGENDWTIGYLFDLIFTRDPWIHRVDICRAIDRDVELTPGHDGRIVADVVSEWATRHGQPFTLTLGGPAGDRFIAGSGGADIAVDAVEFCRILSGRAPGSDLLATAVPF
jgi:uncharacterized protein (TIGR03083 family)